MLYRVDPNKVIFLNIGSNYLNNLKTIYLGHFILRQQISIITKIGRTVDLLSSFFQIRKTRLWSGDFWPSWTLKNQECCLPPPFIGISLNNTENNHAKFHLTWPFRFVFVRGHSKQWVSERFLAVLHVKHLFLQLDCCYKWPVDVTSVIKPPIIKQTKPKDKCVFEYKLNENTAPWTMLKG